MTKLLVRPIALDQPGSYRQRRRFMSLIKRLRKLQGGDDVDAIVQSLEEADDLVRGQLATDDGTPVEDVLETLSASEFDELLSGIAFQSGVGEVSKPSSTAGQEDTGPATTPIG